MKAHRKWTIRGGKRNRHKIVDWSLLDWESKIFEHHTNIQINLFFLSEKVKRKIRK